MYALLCIDPNQSADNKVNFAISSILSTIRYLGHNYTLTYYITLDQEYSHMIVPLGGLYDILRTIKQRNNGGKSLLLDTIDVRGKGLVNVLHERPLFARMLIYCGADVNFKNPVNGLKPIQIAILTNQADVVKALCTRDVDLRQKFFDKDKKYEGCMHAAESLNRFAILPILQEKRCQELSLLKKYVDAKELMLIIIGYEG